MSLELISIVFFLLFNSFFLLPTIYQLQINEYHLPRLSSRVREMRRNGEYLIPLRMPAKSLRNLLIFIISVLLLCLAYTMLLWIKASPLEIVTSGLILSLISKLFPVIGLLATHPIAWWKSEVQIDKATEKVAKSECVFIGVTGSYGKTSVREYLYQLLSSKFRVEKNIGSYNAPDGVAISVNRNLRSDTEYFIAEMGAYHKGIVARSSAIVQPRYGIITGLGNQHIDLFGSKENLVAGKSELFDALPEDGLGFINIDSPNWEESISHAKCKVVKYAIDNPKADIKLEKWILVLAEEKNISNVVNLLPVIALAKHLGMSQEEIRKGVSQLNPLDNKLSVQRYDNGNVLINDSYNSNVEGFVAAIQKLNQLKADNRIIVSKGIIELGEEKANSYRKIIDKIAERTLLISTDKQLCNAYSNSVLVKNEKAIAQAIGLDTGKTYAILIEGRSTAWLISQITDKLSDSTDE